MLEQAEVELRRQHPRDRGIDDVDRHEAAADRVQVRRVLRMRRLEDDVEARSPGVRRGGGVSGSVMCSTVAPPVAAASEMTKPPNPHRPFSTSVSRRRFCVAGVPSTEL